MVEKSEILKILEGVIDPQSGHPITKVNQVKSVELEGEQGRVVIGLTSHSAPLKEDFRSQVLERLQQQAPAVKQWDLTLVDHQRTVPPIGQIGLTCRSVIAVGSGKGGVGKSTVATSLAYGLKKSGCKVGLMDADVYGPSVPQLTGLSGRPTQIEGKIQPIIHDGMPVMSIGFMVPVDEAVIWRGPMLHSAVTQFVRDTAWGDLDYLIIDMPPGTGDVALTLSQLLPLSGSIVVCTPQKVALLDAIKAIAMFHKVKIPVAGIVENMSTFICPDNGKRYDIFGSGGARRLAEEAEIPFLGEIPINISMRERGDEGTSQANLEDPNVAPFIDKIAYQLARRMADIARQNPSKPQLPVLG